MPTDDFEEAVNCSLCAYWEKDDHPSVKFGVCRRYAPRFIEDNGRAIFPITKPSDWCGESRIHPAYTSEGK